MASDRADDFADDEYSDRPRRARRAGGDPDRGRGAVTGPAIGLIAVGGIALVLGLINLAQALSGGLNAQLDAQRDAQIAQIDANPGIPADQKQQQKDMFVKIYDAIKPLMLPGVGLNVLGAAVILLGGVQLLRLRGRGLGIASSVLAMIPCFSSCACVLGIPIGIWALVTLGRADVKAAFAAGGPRDTLADDFPDDRR